MPVAEYRRRLAALRASRPGASTRASAPPAATGEPADDEVRELRRRYPTAFAAIDAEPDLSPAEVAERERLVAAAIQVGYRPPD